MHIREVVEELRKRRQARGITQRELATRLGYKDAGSVRALERPDANPTLRSIQAYAEALDVVLKLEVEHMHVISFFNHAGGAGKSTTARDIGYGLSQRGFKVLMIDADPQANLTEFFGIDASQLTTDETLYATMMGDTSGQRYLPDPIARHGVDIIPSHLQLAVADRQLAGELGGFQRLQRAIQGVEGYDFILIDCPPNLGSMAVAGLIASDHAVIPVQLRKKFRDGLWTAIRTVHDAADLQPGLAPLAIIPTQTDTTVVSRKNLEYLETDVHPHIPVLSSITRRPAAYGEAEEVGLPISAYQPGGDASREVETTTGELLERLGVTVRV